MGIYCPYFTPQRMVQLNKTVRGHLVTFMMESVYLVSAVISWEPKQFRYRLIVMDMTNVRCTTMKRLSFHSLGRILSLQRLCFLQGNDKKCTLKQGKQNKELH